MVCVRYGGCAPQREKAKLRFHGRDRESRGEPVTGANAGQRLAKWHCSPVRRGTPLSVRHKEMTRDNKDLLRIGATIALIILSGLAFYHALFLGWASGAVPPADERRWMIAGNVMFAVSVLTLCGAVGIWLIPYVVRKKRTNHPPSPAHS